MDQHDIADLQLSKPEEEQEITTKQITRTMLCITWICTVFGAIAAHAGPAETISIRIGKLSFTHDFENGYPTVETQDLLLNEVDFQRACQAYLWSIPVVSMAQWQ